MSKLTIEKRCPHGYLRSEVQCPVCDGKKKPVPRGKLVNGEQYNFGTLASSTVAGALVLEREPNDAKGNACWRCRCACGETFVVKGTTLRQKEKAGHVAKCEACKARKGGKP